MSNSEKAPSRHASDRSKLERKTVSSVGATIHVEEIKVPRTLRDAIERQFDQSKAATTVWPKKK